MFDPALIPFGNYKEAVALLSVFLVFVAALSFVGYAGARTEKQKKDVIAFFAVFGSVTAVALAIAVYFGHGA